MGLTGIAFVVAFFGACLLAFVRHPIYGLLAYVSAFYIHPPSRWWGQGILLDVRWSLVAGVVTLVAIAVSGRSTEHIEGFFRGKFAVAFGVFLGWVAVQSFWAVDPLAHRDLIGYYGKFLVAMYLIYRCVDTEQHLRWFLWAHVLGCSYLGWLAYSLGTGGRFEDFGGPGLSEANTAAIQLVTGILVAASLFLASRLWGKLALIGAIPFIVNALVSTISRSGFLAFGVGGLIFNFFTPTMFRKPVRVLSVLGVVLLVLLTNPDYWSRMDTIKQMGEQVEGIDTGSGRLEIMRAQWEMFRQHPMGCGHMCTTALSPLYLDKSHLFEGGRASHNTFMTMLVDHGVFGALAYLLMVVWVYSCLHSLARDLKGRVGFVPVIFPAVAGVLGAVFLADLFVQYPKLEVRFWFIAILMVLMRWRAQDRQHAATVPQSSLAA